MTLVVDASVVVAGLIDTGPWGQWAEMALLSGALVAPHLMPAECANILRRQELRAVISTDMALLAHSDLASLPVELHPYFALAARVFELCATVTAYDA